MDQPARNHVLGLRRISRHVRRRRMRLQRVHARPFLEHQKGIRAVLRLKLGAVLKIDGGPLLDAALFPFDRGDIGAERLQDGRAHAGLGGDDGDDVDHGSDSSCKQLAGGRSRIVAKRPAFPPAG